MGTLQSTGFAAGHFFGASTAAAKAAAPYAVHPV